MFSIEQGKKLIELAKASIKSSFDDKKIDLKDYKEFSKKQGVFVTLKEKGNLRGCIGYPSDYYPLNEAISKAAIAAAFDDPRFIPLDKSELKNIEFEISVLTIPEKIDVKKPEDYLKKIKIGKDGLIVKNKFTSGLLLPQVAKEWNWDALEFLENTCLKAGLSRNAWKEIGTEVYSFQAQIFSEKKGKVVEEKND